MDCLWHTAVSVIDCNTEQWHCCKCNRLFVTANNGTAVSVVDCATANNATAVRVVDFVMVNNATATANNATAVSVVDCVTAYNATAVTV